MARAHVFCPHCNKIAEIDRENVILSLRRKIIRYKCGHVTTEHLVTREQIPGTYEYCLTCKQSFRTDKFEWFDHIEHDIVDVPNNRDDMWALAYPYQREGIEFAEESNVKTLFADEMGLGKTIQMLLTLRYNWNELTPCLISCKSSLVFNWIKEYERWVMKDNPAVQYPPIPHFDGQSEPIPGFPVYFIPMDIVPKPKINAWIKQHGFKCLIVDECHNLNNPTSKRTIGIMKSTNEIQHCMFASGTPIANRPTEYFTTLNKIRPDLFPTMKSFAQGYLEYDWELKRYIGLKESMRERFFQRTGSFILRRTTQDVLKDLPPFRRTEKLVSDFDENFIKAYNKQLDELEAIIDQVHSKAQQKQSFIHVIAKIQVLRHLCALAKVKHCIAHVQEWLKFTDEKLCIGIHHDDVEYWLKKGLTRKWCDTCKGWIEDYTPVDGEASTDHTNHVVRDIEPLTMNGSHNPSEKLEIEKQFAMPEHRLMIAKILACGEGRNFQFCPNALVLERMWNAAKEEQFEKRFHRNGQLQAVECMYMVARGTIDDFMHETVEFKRRMGHDIQDINFETDLESMYQIAKRAISARLRLGI